MYKVNNHGDAQETNTVPINVDYALMQVSMEIEFCSDKGTIYCTGTWYRERNASTE